MSDTKFPTTIEGWKTFLLDHAVTDGEKAGLPKATTISDLARLFPHNPHAHPAWEAMTQELHLQAEAEKREVWKTGEIVVSPTLQALDDAEAARDQKLFESALAALKEAGIEQDPRWVSAKNMEDLQRLIFIAVDKAFSEAIKSADKAIFPDVWAVEMEGDNEAFKAQRIVATIISGALGCGLERPKTPDPAPAGGKVFSHGHQVTYTPSLLHVDAEIEARAFNIALDRATKMGELVSKLTAAGVPGNDAVVLATEYLQEARAAAEAHRERLLKERVETLDKVVQLPGPEQVRQEVLRQHGAPQPSTIAKAMGATILGSD